jgi:hypothetical protein
MKKPSFCEKIGSQIKFCAIKSAYVIYEWYLGFFLSAFWLIIVSNSLSHNVKVFLEGGLADIFLVKLVAIGRTLLDKR